MSESIRAWDIPVRVFHWLPGGSFAGACVASECEQLRSAGPAPGETTESDSARRVSKAVRVVARDRRAFAVGNRSI